MEEKKSLEQIIADNLVYYRKASGLTQLEVAEKFNYSDKSISKWERAEGMPDILVLKALADFYDIRVDDFFKEEKAKIKMTRKSKRWFIFGLSETLVWLVFGIFFTVFSIFLRDVFAWWLLFVYAAATSAILAVVWAGIYHKRLYQLIATSCIIWFTIASVYLTALMVTLPNPNQNLWLLFLIGVPLEVLAILWYFLRKNLKKRTN
jgi:transcriptional regulator with XRE-family HTH domain